MNSPNPTDQVTRQRFQDAWMRMLASNKFIFGHMGYSLLFFFVLGIGFWVAALGLSFAFSTLAPIYNPAYRLFITVFKVEGLPAHAPKPSSWQIFGLLFALVISAFFVYLGVKIFNMLGGFCNQNLICLLGTILFRSTTQ